MSKQEPPQLLLTEHRAPRWDHPTFTMEDMAKAYRFGHLAPYKSYDAETSSRLAHLEDMKRTGLFGPAYFRDLQQRYNLQFPTLP
jgi:hypothetical protein